ncbi:hypothetical protein D9757_012206 [Collybiopsis confluens]|uniref:S-adenosyl-L-methionine-dependent methyltransferase n=1 Tax=Collybiopsis confluens TaxID=2823264 RepID=A0A8H5FTY5_9AGAR|nr:hypothetical protein D9757_014582 [Collybiopsis confluens]KAF5349061.1 hypothetical protein D9757_012206 [Collybiopsis confluens]
MSSPDNSPTNSPPSRSGDENESESETAADERQFAGDTLSDDSTNGNGRSSDTELEELRDDDFPTYFAERDGRLYQADSAASPYPLPVDTPENQRVTFLHKCLLEVVGAHYIGPVHQVLASVEGQQRKVVDLGCGLGEWVTEMARQFPHVSFHGLDIVPIATRYPEVNAQFELHDIGEEWRWPASSIDMVHARSIFMTVRDFSVIINEAARVLKPGGLFLSGEWLYYPSFSSSFPESRTHPSEHVPFLHKLYTTFHTILIQRGIQSPIAPYIADRLQSSGHFHSINPMIFHVPIGTWSSAESAQRIGRGNRAALKRFLDSIKPMLLQDSGMLPEEIEDMYAGCLAEMYNMQGLVSVYYLVSALKV